MRNFGFGRRTPPDDAAIVVEHAGALDGASLRATLLDLEQREPAPVLVLQGATVTGTVDLSFLEFRSALRFVDCTFTGGVVRLEGSGMVDVRFSGCAFEEGSRPTACGPWGISC